MREGSRGLPAGTITLLLADVEGSVRLWERDREAMRYSMKTLEELACEAIERHGGARPVEQGEGDNLVAGFTRATDALACAVAIQIALQNQAWPGEVPRLRIGVHTGEVELRDEGRYDGQAVNRCARLRDLGHGGQILLSRTAHDLVAELLPDGTTLTGLGAYTLRDMARSEHVYQVCHPELPSGFPALRTSGAASSNLPRQLTSFIGREAEMAAVREILTEARLVTLTGSGGCGKTRLGLQVATQLLDAYSDGVWWVDLARLSEPGLVPGALASALGVHESPGRPVVDAVVGHLSGRQCLLLLDNCEHLIEACSEFADDVLRSCPNVGILATSREPLRVLGEVAWRVPSLEVPDPDAGVDALSRCEAARLFVDRAVRVRPNFHVTEAGAPAVAQICSRLDGIPLAIELAAARTRMMTPEQIVAGLDDRFRLLTGSQRGILPRHQTLEASVGWSYDLLGPDERTMLARLSVFRGSFTLDAAEAVGAGDGIERIDVLGLLSDLVDRSLVQVGEEGRDARYRLLETIRQYATDRLTASGEEAEARTRHLDHYVAFAERAEPELFGPRLREWLEVLDLEHDNLRAAMDHGQRSGQAEEVLRIAAGIWMYWMVRGHVAEGRRRVEAAIESADVDPLVRARALVGVCQIAMLEYSPPWALELAQEALTLAREAGDEQTIGRALTTLAATFGFRRSAAAPAIIDEAIEACTRTDEGWFLATALHARYEQEVAVYDILAARRTADEVVAHCRAHGDLHGLARYLGPLAFTLVPQGSLDAAEAAYEEGLEISRDLGTQPWVDWCLAGLAFIAGLRGDYDRATTILNEIVSRQRTSGALLPTYLMWLAYVDTARGDLRSAVEHADELLAVARAIDMEGFIVRGFELKADALVLAGDLDTASAVLDEARELGLGGWWARMTARSRLLRLLGEHQQAEDAFHDSLRRQMDTGFYAEVPQTLESLAGLAALAESDEEAARLFGAAEAQRERMGTMRWAVEQDACGADVALVRDRLSADDFERAWEEGRSMSLQEAVAYASRGRGERKRPSSGWASLTPAEVDVVKLASEGLTNPQIAERLFVARSTVKAHLSSIFRKLGVSTRAELATEATRRGLSEPAPS